VVSTRFEHLITESSLRWTYIQYKIRTQTTNCTIHACLGI